MFSASDLGGYAAAASIWNYTATGNCRCGQKYLVPEGTKPFYFNGAFFILAQVRGNWGGVSFTLRMITTRWVTSVPGMV